MALRDLLSSIPFEELSTTSYALIPIILLSFFLTLRWINASKLPTINSHPGDFAQKKARVVFFSNARNLLAEGRQKVSTRYANLKKSTLTDDVSLMALSTL